MADKPLDLTVEIAPKARFDMVDLRQTFAAEHHALAAFPRCLYWSCHTTAGFLERGLASRLSAQHIPSYLEALRTIFPEGAGYEHDRLEARSDLDPDQRAVEPRNADSHLAFMAGGLRTCVTHPNAPTEHVFFVDLDGVNDGRPRQRRTRLIGYNNEHQVASTRIEVPVSSHAVDSINLKDPEIGVYAQLLDFVRRSGVERGRLRLSLDPAERHSGLTVNEYETLLMRHDLAEVLGNPFRFVAEKYRHVMANPLAVPARTLDYAKYDLVQVVNECLDRLGLRGSVVERLLSRTVAVPASRFFRMRRSVSLLVAAGEGGDPTIVEGVYQSPILVQWRNAPRSSRVVDVSLAELQ